MITFSVPYERIVEHRPAVMFGDQAERMVNRRLNDHRIARFCEYVHSQSNSFDNPRNVCKPFALYMPSVTGILPVCYGFPI